MRVGKDAEVQELIQKLFYSELNSDLSMTEKFKIVLKAAVEVNQANALVCAAGDIKAFTAAQDNAKQIFLAVAAKLDTNQATFDNAVAKLQDEHVAQLSNLKSEITTLKEHKTQADNAIVENEQLKSEKTQLLKQLDNVNTQIEMYKIDFEKLKRFDDLDKQFSELSTQYKVAQNDLKNRNEKIDDLSLEINKIQADYKLQLDKLMENNQSEADKKSALVSQLNVLKNTVNNQKDRIKELTSDFANVKDEHKQEIESLKAEFKVNLEGQLNQQKTMYEQQLQSLKEQQTQALELYKTAFKSAPATSKAKVS